MIFHFPDPELEGMMRLADFLLRWIGDVAYTDYIERNLYNGILAQQHPETGMVAHFLPLQAGGRCTSRSGNRNKRVYAD